VCTGMTTAISCSLEHVPHTFTALSLHCLGQLSLAFHRGRQIEYQLRLGKGGNVISAGWQVTLCDPLWHASRCSGVCGNAAMYIADCYIRIPRRLCTDTETSILPMWQVCQQNKISGKSPHPRSHRPLQQRLADGKFSAGC